MPEQSSGNASLPVEVIPQEASKLVEITNVSAGVLVFLLAVWTIAGHNISQRTKYLGEGSTACIMGLVTGALLLAFHHYINKGVIHELLVFNSATFFTFLLPPVIFHCGLSVEKKRFFQNLPTILLYGIVGTLISFCIVAGFLYGFTIFHVLDLEDCLALGAIFAATDSVAVLQVLDQERTPQLFSLVFGEGVINDATSVVLMEGVAAAYAPRSSGQQGSIISSFTYLFVTSLVMGGAAGGGIALLLSRFKCTGPHQEVALVGLLSYLCYLCTEAMGLSGILALFVCGIVVSHFALRHISATGRTTVVNSVRMMSYVCEGTIFIYVGMDAFDPAKWQAANAAESLWFVAVVLVLLAVSRALFVIAFSLLINFFSIEPLGTRDIVIIWWSGLMRGAVSLALVYFHFDVPGALPDDAARNSTIIVTTLLVVLLSVLGYGAMTKPLMEVLLRDVDRPLLETLAALRDNVARKGMRDGLLDYFRGQRRSSAAESGGPADSDGGESWALLPTAAATRGPPHGPGAMPLAMGLALRSGSGAMSAGPSLPVSVPATLRAPASERSDYGKDSGVAGTPGSSVADGWLPASPPPDGASSSDTSPVKLREVSHHRRSSGILAEGLGLTRTLGTPP